MFDTAQPQAGEPANQPVIEAADQDIGKESSSISDDLGDGGEVAADEPFLTVRYNKEQKTLKKWRNTYVLFWMMGGSEKMR